MPHDHRQSLCVRTILCDGFLQTAKLRPDIPNDGGERIIIGGAGLPVDTDDCNKCDRNYSENLDRTSVGPRAWCSEGTLAPQRRSAGPRTFVTILSRGPNLSPASRS